VKIVESSMTFKKSLWPPGTHRQLTNLKFQHMVIFQFFSNDYGQIPVFIVIIRIHRPVSNFTNMADTLKR